MIFSRHYPSRFQFVLTTDSDCKVPNKYQNREFSAQTVKARVLDDRNAITSFHKLHKPGLGRENVLIVSPPRHKSESRIDNLKRQQDLLFATVTLGFFQCFSHTDQNITVCSSQVNVESDVEGTSADESAGPGGGGGAAASLSGGSASRQRRVGRHEFTVVTIEPSPNTGDTGE